MHAAERFVPYETLKGLNAIGESDPDIGLLGFAGLGWHVVAFLTARSTEYLTNCYALSRDNVADLVAGEAAERTLVPSLTQ